MFLFQMKFIKIQIFIWIGKFIEPRNPGQKMLTYEVNLFQNRNLKKVSLIIESQSLQADCIDDLMTSKLDYPIV